MRFELTDLQYYGALNMQANIQPAAEFGKHFSELAPHIVKAVYDSSVPIGLGHFRDHEAALTEDDIRDIVVRAVQNDKHFHLDYINGRCCKLLIRWDSAPFMKLADHREPVAILQKAFVAAGHELGIAVKEEPAAK